MLTTTPKISRETALKALLNTLAAAVRAAEKRKASHDQRVRE